MQKFMGYYNHRCYHGAISNVTLWFQQLRLVAQPLRDGALFLFRPPA
jgi:hypothetical protein